MVQTRRSNNKDGQKVAKVTPIKLKENQKKKQKATKTNKGKAVKKKISTKHKVTMQRKIYNDNSPPVKTTTKMQKKKLFKSKVQPQKHLKFKKLKTKKYSMNANQRHMLTMHSEICAFNNVVLMHPVRQDGSPGFVYNIHHPVLKTPETKHSLIQETNLDLSYINYPYF